MTLLLRSFLIVSISFGAFSQQLSNHIQVVTDQFDTTYYQNIEAADSLILIAIEKAEQTKRPVDLGHVYYRKGILFDIQGESDKAAEFLFKGIEQLEQTDDWRGLSAAYNNLSVYYFNIFDYAKVIETSEKEIAIYDEYGLNEDKAYALNNMALAYKYLDQPKEALSIQLEALELFQSMGDTNALQSVYANIGTSYFNMKEYGRALDYYKQSEEIIQSTSNQFNLITLFNSMGQTYLALEEYDSAQGYLDQALKIAKVYDAKEREQYIYESLADLAAAKGDHKAALKYYKQFHAIGMELYQSERNDAMAKYEKKFEVYESREKQREAELEVAKRERMILYVSIGLLVMLVLSGLLIYAVRMRNKAVKSGKAELESRNRLMREMHHRIKNNLQLVESMLSIQSRRMDEDSAAQLDGVRGSIQAMAGIHEGLYSRGTGEQIDTKDFFSNLEQNLIRSDQDEVNLSVKTDQFNTDIDTVVSIGIILNELFTNSLKYAFEPGDDKRIEIELRRGKDSLVLKYRDYGKGVQVQANDERSTSFGMKMIKATMRKLKAELHEEHPERGVSYTFIINRFQRF